MSNQYLLESCSKSSVKNLMFNAFISVTLSLHAYINAHNFATIHQRMSTSQNLWEIAMHIYAKLNYLWSLEFTIRILPTYSASDHKYSEYELGSKILSSLNHGMQFNSKAGMIKFSKYKYLQTGNWMHLRIFAKNILTVIISPIFNRIP